MASNLIKIIKKTTGLSIVQFVEEKLGTEYHSFKYREKAGALRLHEYHTICFLTGMSFEDLWPNPQAPASKKISLNLSPSSQTIPKLSVKKSVSINPEVPQVPIEPKKQPEKVIAPPAAVHDDLDFDPFAGGIPD